MKIAIISRNTKLYSTARLVEAARARGHRVRVLDPLRCYMRIEPSKFAVHYKGRALADYDAVIPRVGASITFYGTAVLRQFEMMGVFTPNSSDAILRARDKLRCLQLLAREGLGLPTTVFGDNPDDTADLLAMLGDPPHVIKLVEGSQGQGVLLAEKKISVAKRHRSVSRLIRQLSRAGIHQGSARRGYPLFRCRRTRRGRDASAGARGRVPVESASRRLCVDGAIERGGKRYSVACGSCHGPEHRRRGFVAVEAGTVGSGSEFLAGTRRDRIHDRARYCRGNRRLPSPTCPQASYRQKAAAYFLN